MGLYTTNTRKQYRFENLECIKCIFSLGVDPSPVIGFFLLPLHKKNLNNYLFKKKKEDEDGEEEEDGKKKKKEDEEERKRKTQ